MHFFAKCQQNFAFIHCGVNGSCVRAVLFFSLCVCERARAHTQNYVLDKTWGVKERAKLRSKYSQLKRFVSTLVGTKFATSGRLEIMETDGKMKTTTTATTLIIETALVYWETWIAAILMLFLSSFTLMGCLFFFTFWCLHVSLRGISYACNCTERCVCVCLCFTEEFLAPICNGHITLWFYYHNGIIAGRACIQFQAMIFVPIDFSIRQ